MSQKWVEPFGNRCIVGSDVLGEECKMQGKS